MDLGNQIRKYRLLRGLSQTQLAELLKTRQNIVSMWESNRIEPNVMMLRRLAEVLEVRVDEILDTNTKVETNVSKNSDKRIESIVTKLSKMDETKKKKALKLINSLITSI